MVPKVDKKFLKEIQASKSDSPQHKKQKLLPAKSKGQAMSTHTPLSLEMLLATPPIAKAIVIKGLDLVGAYSEGLHVPNVPILYVVSSPAPLKDKRKGKLSESVEEGEEQIPQVSRSSKWEDVQEARARLLNS
ncbi:unnamed protein product, partial [Ilex paraguariensis]